MKSQKGIIHLGLILVLLIFGIGALVFVMYKTNSLPVVTTASPTPETMMEQYMREWKSFSDSGYTFQYPSHWVFTPSKSTNPAARTHNLTNVSDKTRHEHTEDSRLNLNSLGKDFVAMDINIKDLVFPYNYISQVNNIDVNVDNYSEYLREVAGEPSPSTDFVISNLATYQDKQTLDFNFTQGAVSEGVSWYQAYGNDKLIQIKVTYATLDPRPFIETDTGKIVSQILSTFEFIENSSSSDKKTTTFTSKKIPGLSFPAISIDIPNNWQKTVENESYLDLRLTNEKYFIQITQDAWGGSVCLFDDTPNFEGPSNDLKGKSYKQFTANNGDIYRRYQTEFNYESKIIIGVCQKQEISGYFVSPTIWASVQYRVPENYSESMLEEMDNIIKTLKPVN